MAKFTAKTEDFGLARRFRQEAMSMDRRISNLVRNLGKDSELIFAAHALRDTGRMARGITSHVAGSTALVTVFAKNPESGYDYVGVTRFGHRVARITPKHPPKADRFYPKTAKAFPIPGVGFRSSIRGFAALKTPFGFRRSVRGFHPASDWAEPAQAEVRIEAERAMAREGNEITARLAG